jgi:hypothetical protein
MFSNRSDNGSPLRFRWYQIRASRKKLNRAVWMTFAAPNRESVLKKIVAPNTLSNAATNLRYVFRPCAFRTFTTSRPRNENGWLGFVSGRLKWPGILARYDPDRTAARIQNVWSLGVETVRCVARIGVGRQEGDAAENRTEQTDGN